MSEEKPKADTANKEKKKRKPGVPNKITCTKCKAIKGASRDRYLKLIGKAGDIDYESDEQILEAVGGVGSAKWNELNKKVTSTYLCRACRPKTKKKKVEETKGE